VAESGAHGRQLLINRALVFGEDIEDAAGWSLMEEGELCVEHAAQHACIQVAAGMDRKREPAEIAAERKEHNTCKERDPRWWKPMERVRPGA
jgi:hypothetical protein